MATIFDDKCRGSRSGFVFFSFPSLSSSSSLPTSATSSIDTIDIKGNITSSRKLVFKTKEEYIEKISVQTKGYPATSNNEQVEYELQDVTKYRSKVTILPIGSTPPSVGNEITEVIPLNGYFPTHYRYKNNLSQGLKNSFFEGSKQTVATTPEVTGARAAPQVRLADKFAQLGQLRAAVVNFICRRVARLKKADLHKGVTVIHARREEIGRGSLPVGSVESCTTSLSGLR